MNREAKIKKVKNGLKLGAYGTLAGETGEYLIERLGSNAFLVYSDHQLNEEMFQEFEEDMGDFITHVPRDGITKAYFVTPFAVLKGDVYRIAGWNHDSCTMQISASQPPDIEGFAFVSEDRNVYTAQINYAHENLGGLLLLYTQAWNIEPDEKVLLQKEEIDLTNNNLSSDQKK
jgi:hypothetical protein